MRGTLLSCRQCADLSPPLALTHWTSPIWPHHTFPRLRTLCPICLERSPSSFTWPAPHHVARLSKCHFSNDTSSSLISQARALLTNLPHFILFPSSFCMFLLDSAPWLPEPDPFCSILCTQHPEELLHYSKSSVNNCEKNILVWIILVFTEVHLLIWLCIIVAF